MLTRSYGTQTGANYCPILEKVSGADSISRPKRFELSSGKLAHRDVVWLCKRLLTVGVDIENSAHLFLHLISLSQNFCLYS